MAGLKLQSDIRQDFKGPKDTATAYQTMYNAATNPTQKGDTTMLYTFFKVLDPQSTVREGEIEMIKQSRSIPEKFKGMAIKLASGQTLLESERADLLNQAYQYVANQQRGVTETITADAAFVAYKTITFDTLDIPESAEYVWEMRLKSMRNEAGTSIISNFTISYLLSFWCLVK